MKPRWKAAFITIVPAPYQRDLFGALAARGDVDLSVYYMEAAAPDSPWPEAPLRPFEQIMPGKWASFRGARAHINWPLPDLTQADFVVLSSYSSLTGQLLMRRRLSGKRWLFWGERMRVQPAGWRETVQRNLAAPMAKASGIVGIGRLAVADYSRRFPHLPHFCIPYHTGLKEFLEAPRRDRGDGPLRFFCCGQMIRRKGVDLLLIAFDKLIAKGHKIELMLVGREAELPEFMAGISPEARAHVRYEGFQAPGRLPEYFSQSDVFVLPSRHDGWGVVINQAIGAGLPVISSDAAGAGLDLVEPGVNGLHCAAGDLDSLQNAMEQFALNPGLARQWGEASRARALAITPEAGAEKWAHVFETLSAPMAMAG
jgi:glycosyltransferase involved in cell wall biosynthesis